MLKVQRFNYEGRCCKRGTPQERKGSCGPSYKKVLQEGRDQEVLLPFKGGGGKSFSWNQNHEFIDKNGKDIQKGRREKSRVTKSGWITEKKKFRKRLKNSRSQKKTLPLLRKILRSGKGCCSERSKKQERTILKRGKRERRQSKTDIEGLKGGALIPNLKEEKGNGIVHRPRLNQALKGGGGEKREI